MKELLLITGMALWACCIYAQDNLERTDNFPTGYIKGAYPYYFGSVDGVLYVFLGANPGFLVKYPSNDPRESFTIPNTVSRIGKGAFKGCHNLREIVIPSSVYYIGDDAFDDTEIERFVVSGNDVSTHNIPVSPESPGIDGFYDMSGRVLDCPPSGVGIRVEEGIATKILAN